MLRPKLNRVWSNSSSMARRDPGDTKYIQGWLSEIPTYQVLNYLQWKTDATFLALAERGVFEWGSDVSYKKGAAAWDETDGAIYIAQMNNPSTALTPSKNANGWKKSAIQITRQSYDDAVAAITKHIADVTSNPHKLTPGRLGTYTVAQIDELVAKYRAEVKAHADDTSNPHKTTATAIGAVPVTGGKYTGNVTMKTGQILLDADGRRKVVSDASGVYMTNGSGQVGVDATGKAFVKTGTLPSSLVITESTFADNKALTEPDYAVPKPVLFMPLIRDINIYIGGGAADAAWAVRYGADGTLSFPIQTGSSRTLEMSTIPCVGAAEVTIAADLMCEANTDVAAGEICGMGIGSTSGCVRIYVRSDGSFSARSDSGVVNSERYPAGALHRVVARLTATDLTLFVNGAEAGKVIAANKPIDDGTLATLQTSASTSAAQNVAAHVCNFRVWSGALTDKQISAL